MSFIQFITGVCLVFALSFTVWRFYRYRQARLRKKLYAEPLKPEWVNLLNENVPLVNGLPKTLKNIYHGHVNYFLATKEFVGRGGFEITDKARLTIAGNACLLVLKRKTPIFPGFQTIIVYPDTYHVPSLDHNDGVVVQKMQSRAGESWYRGPIVLSWSDVERGSGNINDAHNVVIHEFAHKLDEENQLMDGLPILRESAHYKEWTEVLNKEFTAFLKRVEKNQNRVIDSYGAISPVEFFAVISESFFEKPQQMKRKLPALYHQLSQYYGVDVAEW